MSERLSEELSAEEQFVALAHVYLEVTLPLSAAVLAACADLQDLDAGFSVAEAA
jgi:hypothetical protein